MTIEEVTVKARKAIDTLWNTCLARARGWGLKGKGDNVFEGSNIILINKEEVVILAIDSEKRGEIVIHEFTKVSDTVLGSQVATLLHYHKVPRRYKKHGKQC